MTIRFPATELPPIVDQASFEAYKKLNREVIAKKYPPGTFFSIKHLFRDVDPEKTRRETRRERYIMAAITITIFACLIIGIPIMAYCLGRY